MSRAQQFYRHPQPFYCSDGQQLAPLELCYETLGQLNAQRNNVIVINHALSTHAHVATHPDDPRPGWWEPFVGAGRAIDTDRFFVICINNLGSCHGSSSPISINPKTDKTYQADFPQISIEDIAQTQLLLLDALNIDQVYAIIGPSMGGFISLSLAAKLQQRLQYLISIASAYRAYPANAAIRTLQRAIIAQDPHWQNGYYGEQTLEGFVLARKFAHLTYRNIEELNQRFPNLNSTEQSIHSYLDYNARKFTQQFDANSYCRLTAAMDQFDLRCCTHHFQHITANTLIVSTDSDQLFTPQQQSDLDQALRAAQVPTTYKTLHSPYGHDTFLVEVEQLSELIINFLAK